MCRLVLGLNVVFVHLETDMRTRANQIPTPMCSLVPHAAYSVHIHGILGKPHHCTFTAYGICCAKHSVRLDMSCVCLARRCRSKLGYADINSAAHQQLALEAAQQAVVLLKNDGAGKLPWSANKKVSSVEVDSPAPPDLGGLCALVFIS